MNAEDFFLLDGEDGPENPELDRHGAAALPVRDRRPVDAGFVLAWQETGRGDPCVRTGMVLSTAPKPGTVWVVPDDTRPGDGFAVIVGDVTSDDASQAARQVGGPGDFRSTAGWQRPRTLPRAWLRADLLIYDGERRVARFLHSRPDCEHPATRYGEQVQRGVPVPAEGCYVFGDRLHSCSARPYDPDSRGRRSHLVRTCGSCLLDGLP